MLPVMSHLSVSGMFLPVSLGANFCIRMLESHNGRSGASRSKGGGHKDSAIFLPCCYGYATTTRRAQGLSLVHGCLYFDQAWRAAGRGYGYVAVSRFKTRNGVHLYGKIRRTDFLPVGGDVEEEVLERGHLSGSSDDEDGSGMDEAFGSFGAGFESGDEADVIVAVDFE